MNDYLQVESGLPQGKWLLYLTDPVELSPPGVGECFLNPRHVNSLGLRRKSDKSAAGFAAENPGTGDENPPKFYAGGAGQDSVYAAVENVNQDVYVPYSSAQNKFSSSSSSSNSVVSQTYSYKSVMSERRRTETLSERIRSKRSDLSSASRVRRDTEGRIDPDHILDAEGRLSRVVVFDCGRGSAKCLSISCDIPHLSRGEHAIIRNGVNTDGGINSSKHNLVF